MPVNILNLQGLTVSDFKETDTEYHVKGQSSANCWRAFKITQPCALNFTQAL